MSLDSPLSIPAVGTSYNDHWWILYPNDPTQSLMVSIIDDPLKYDTPQGMGVFTGVGAVFPIVVLDAIYATTITCSFLLVPFAAAGASATYGTPMDVLTQLRWLRATKDPLVLSSPFGDSRWFIFGSGSGSSSNASGSSSGQYSEQFYSPTPTGDIGADALPVIQVDVTLIEVAPSPGSAPGVP